MQMTHENIGHRIKQIRCAKGLSQEELARQVDLPRTAITKIEAGSQDVRFRELEKLSEALGISLGNLVEEKRPVRQGPDEEFFRVCEPVADFPAHTGTDNRLRTMLLLILERCAGNPEMNEQRLGTIVRQADQASLKAYGETISGVACHSPHRQQTITEALALMASNQELMRIETRDTKTARLLPLVKADLRQLTAAEYVLIEQAVCMNER